MDFSVPKSFLYTWLLKTTCHAFYFYILQVNKYEFNLDEPAYHDKEQGTCRIASGFGNI